MLQIAKALIKFLFGLIFDPQLSRATISENIYLLNLKSTFKNIKIYKIENVTSAKGLWFANLNRIRELVLTANPREFLRWDVIKYTMFIEYSKFISIELKYIRQLENWDRRWSSALKESRVGRPFPFITYPKSSGNLIHHAYSVAVFENKTNISVENLDFVFEFGGGYGSMCRLFQALNFKGRYVIYDLEPLSALQTYYLMTLGFNVLNLDEFIKSSINTNCICCISNVYELSVIKTLMNSSSASLFVATWSLSESPIEVREEISLVASECDNALIALQSNFGEIDNIKYFNEYKSKFLKVDWIDIKIQHLTDNYYLFGKSKLN
jgi:hypothetical protein